MLLFQFRRAGLFFGINVSTWETSIVGVRSAIGLGIDFSIHFISWYRHETHCFIGMSKKALDENDRQTRGRAILYKHVSSSVLGFLALLFSSFVPARQFRLACVAVA